MFTSAIICSFIFTFSFYLFHFIYLVRFTWKRFSKRIDFFHYCKFKISYSKHLIFYHTLKYVQLYRNEHISDHFPRNATVMSRQSCFRNDLNYPGAFCLIVRLIDFLRQIKNDDLKLHGLFTSMTFYIVVELYIEISQLSYNYTYLQIIYFAIFIFY